MIRGIDLRGGIALNVITMIGIGPLITIPLVLAQLHGSLALAGWVAGAVVALCDGLVWAALASRYPGAGGTYVYLRDIFGPERWGRFAAFLYNWQGFLSGGLILSTGCVGFAQYTGYLYPAAASDAAITHAIAVSVGVLAIVLAYRKITAIARVSAVLGIVAVLTLAIVTIAGFSHGDVHRAVSSGGGASASASFGWGFVVALGGALFITLYDYTGYAQIAVVGEEVREPQRTIPRAIVLSILIVFVLYVTMQVGVLCGMPAGPATNFIGSVVVEHAWGRAAAIAVTLLVLVTAFASVFGGLVGTARIPFAAARDGVFFSPFSRLHPSAQFPHVALLGIGLVMLAGCFFDLTALIALFSAAAILTGSIAQIVALFVLAYRGETTPFRMWLFPLPALVALAGWIYAFVSTGTLAIVEGVGWMILGGLVYAVIYGFMRKRPESSPS